MSQVRTMEEIALINNLNDDCLKHIFSFLRVRERLEIEKVCKRWRNIGEEGWNDVKELRINNDDSENSVYLMLKRCGRYLKKLATEHPHSLPMVIQFCKLDQLEEIELKNVIFVEGDVLYNMPDTREILEKSENLVAVHLEGDFSNDVYRYMDCLKPMTLRKLRLIDRTRSSSINPDQFPNLKELYLDGIDTIRDDEMARNGESLKGLESLNIIRCSDAEDFIQRIWTFTNLRELGICSEDLYVQNEDIRLIAMHCPNIAEMKLRKTDHLTSDCLQYLGEMRSLEVVQLVQFRMDTCLAYLTNVKVLIFYRCWIFKRAEGLIELIVNSSNLEELLFRKSHRVGRKFLNDVERIFQLGLRTKTLKVIIKPRMYRSFERSTKVTYHPLLKLKVQKDLVESEESDSEHFDSDYDWS